MELQSQPLIGLIDFIGSTDKNLTLTVIMNTCISNLHQKIPRTATALVTFGDRIKSSFNLLTGNNYTVF